MDSKSIRSIFPIAIAIVIAVSIAILLFLRSIYGRVQIKFIMKVKLESIEIYLAFFRIHSVAPRQII